MPTGDTIIDRVSQESTLNALVGAAFGAAGQRCMALSTAVMVGEAQEWVTEIAERATKLKAVLSRIIQISNSYLEPNSGICCSFLSHLSRTVKFH